MAVTSSPLITPPWRGSGGPAACGPTLDTALATPVPVLVEAILDPFEPPMPPKATFEQARNFAESLAKGRPRRGRIAFTVLSDKVRELIETASRRVLF
jgi:pyruvate dehydrogenase (quinone)